MLWTFWGGFFGEFWVFGKLWAKKMREFGRAVRVLAPMEGLTDPLMRRVLTQIACDLGTPYDWAVSEFVRVTHYALPKHVFIKAVPELEHAGKTASGTPVHVQLLGSNPDAMAQSACVAMACGAGAIDLNFGCPAKTVNHHKGGAVLLETPVLIHDIVRAVRQALPKQVPVSAKIRLGYSDSSQTYEIGCAICEAGADWLTVHARTKVDGYRPPAYWDKIAPLTALPLPIIANGEIWNASDARRCSDEAQTTHLMLGRGAVTRPDLIAQIGNGARLSWHKLVVYQRVFLEDDTPNQSGLLGRYKQWLGMLTQGYSEAAVLWEQVKKLKDPAQVKALLLASVSV